MSVPVTLTATQLQTALDVLEPARTFTNWSQQLVQRGIQTPVPVGVSWAWAANDVALPRRNLVMSGSLSTDPKPLLPKSGAGGADQILDSGLVTRLHDDLYARLRHGRLVLIGGPGAGKTGAIILLLMEALKYRRDQVQDPDQAGVPVPVWLTPGSWDPTSQTQGGLKEWVTATITRREPKY